MAPTAAVDLRGAAQQLHEWASAWAGDGLTSDDFLRRHVPLPGDLSGALGGLLRPPDRDVGTRVFTGLLDPFLPAGPTPARWGLPQTRADKALDIAIAIIARTIGRPFAWTGQQDGRLVHDIVPTPGFETMQVGASSKAPLEWHTEDAFHPERSHLVMLTCIRNLDRIGSRVASIRDVRLTGAEMDLLRRRDLRILPDDSYPSSWHGDADERGISTVWDAEDGPCLRYDPAYTDFLPGDPGFRAAYDRLGAELDQVYRTVDIGPGDVLLIDNDLVVHGRSPFTPRYDGTDRWLKRILLHLDRPRPADADGEHHYDQPISVPTEKER